MKQELVSVIIATYNRPKVLTYALKTLVYQTYQNLEIIVVGDHCNADTESAVKTIADPRISYHNLSENCGEQSGPNNYGLSISKGHYIAFLNHDDLLFPDHIANLISVIKDKDCDLAYSLFAAPSDQIHTPMVNAMSDTSRLNIQLMYPASSILLKRAVYEKVGGWKYFREIYDMPSQDWFYRIYKNGYKIRCSNQLSMIAIQSGKRKNSYIEDQSMENKQYYDQLICNHNLLRADLLTRQIMINSLKWNSTGSIFRSLIGKIIGKILSALGIRMRSIRFWWRYRKKGGFIDYLRIHRGLKVK